MLVLDASAGVEYLLRTTIGKAVARRIHGGKILVPELFHAEVLAILRKGTIRQWFDSQRAEQAVDDLISWRVQSVSHKLLIRAAWTFRHNVTAYDAMYLALAKLHNCSVVTADSALARAPRMGIVIENLTG